jgi:hypothetical protein
MAANDYYKGQQQQQYYPPQGLCTRLDYGRQFACLGLGSRRFKWIG